MTDNASPTTNRVLAVLIVLASVGIVVLGAVIVRDAFIKPEAPRTATERDLEAAQAAVRAKPRDAAAHTDLGNAYFRTGDYEAAAGQFKTALSLNRMYLAAQFNLAMVYKAQGRLDLAVNELSALLRKYPADDAALFRLGEIYMEQKKYDKAIAAFKKAVRANPIVADAHFSLAVAYEKSGRRAEAVKEYKQVLRYIPDHAEARAAVKRLTKKP